MKRNVFLPMAAGLVALSAIAMAQSNMPMQHSMPGAASQTEANKAYSAAMQKMDGPMMQGIAAADPDIAFVKGMIPHHQGAIDMAKAVLRFGKDAEVKKWAGEIIEAQEREIAQMNAWLAKHGG